MGAVQLHFNINIVSCTRFFYTSKVLDISLYFKSILLNISMLYRWYTVFENLHEYMQFFTGLHRELITMNTKNYHYVVLKVLISIDLIFDEDSIDIGLIALTPLSHMANGIFP